MTDYSTDLDALLDPSPTGDYLSIFSTLDFSSDAYNANLWGGGGASLDFSGIVYKEDTTLSHCFVAISKRHLICTTHRSGLPLILGNDLYFIDSNEDVYVGLGILDLPYTGGPTQFDSFQVVYLSEDLPATVAIYPLMADTDLKIAGSPCIRIDAERQATIADVFSFGPFMTAITPTSPTRLAYYEDAVSGDSGGPMFLLSGSQLIYFGSAVVGGSGVVQGPNVLYDTEAVMSACRILDQAGDNTGHRPTLWGAPSISSLRATNLQHVYE